MDSQAPSGCPTWACGPITAAPEQSEPARPGETAGQDNARRSAENYLATGAFSRNGLIEQLSSEYGEGFSKADAIYAVNHINVDWNEQAAKSAKNYLESSPFSRQGLIEPLSSEYGEGFTHAQALYGVNAAYR
jgi:Host cell surface-exposed lipoprotein